MTAPHGSGEAASNWLQTAETAADHLGIQVMPGRAPRSRRWEVEGGIIHGLDWGGDGDLLLCLHGVGQNAHDWDLFALHMRDQYRVVALDLRGHGDSSWFDANNYLVEDYAADIEAVCRAEGWRAHVVGASLGGLIGAVFACAAPELARTVTLIDVAIREGEMFDRIQQAVVGDYATTDLTVLRQRAVERTRILPEEYVWSAVLHRVRILEDQAAVWKHDVDVVRQPAVLDKQRVLERARQLTMPVLMVRGQHSRVLDEEALVEMRQAFPHADLVEVPDAGHLVAIDNPREAGLQVRNWLARQPNQDRVGQRVDP